MKTMTLAALAAFLPAAAIACAAHAHDGMSVRDGYARAANPQAGAAFMVLENHRDVACTLVGATSPTADVVELHTHRDEGGVMKMMRVEGGFAVPAGGEHALARGGDHVMFLGLKEPWANGTVVPVTLDFGDCGTVETEVTVDNDRKPDAAGTAQGGMAHDGMAHGAHGSHGAATPAPAPTN